MANLSPLAPTSDKDHKEVGSSPDTNIARSHSNKSSKCVLPSPELLFLILKATLEAFPQAFHPVHSSSPLFVASHVCRTWRKEVLMAKVLWNRFRIDDITSQTLIMLKTTLDRSRGIDISFDVAARARSDETRRQTLDRMRVFKLLWDERNRWKEVQLLLEENESRKEYQKWPLFEMPALLCLHFSSNVVVLDDDDEEDMGWRVDLEQATHLRKLCLNTPFRLVTTKCPPLSCLTSLSLSERTIFKNEREQIRNAVSIVNLLQLTPNLMHCDFICGDTDGDAIFKVNEIDKPLSFPYLRSFALSMNEVSGSSFITNLYAPNLRYLVFDGVYSDPRTLEYIHELLSRWQPPLVHLQLGDMSLSITQLFNVLQTVPTIEELIFFSRTSFHLSFLKELTSQTTFPSAATEAVNDNHPTSTFTSSSNTSTTTHPCPNLRLLIFRGRFWGQPFAPLSDAAEEDLAHAIAALSHLGLEELHSENELIAHMPVDVRAELEGPIVEGITLKTYLPGECPVRELCRCEDVKKAFDPRFSGW